MISDRPAINADELCLTDEMCNLYQSLFQQSHMAQAILDPSFQILDVNDAFCTIVGFPREQLLAMDFADFKRKKMLDYLFDEGEGFEEARKQKRMTKSHTGWNSSTGRHVVNRTIIPVPGSAGTIAHYFVLYDEVTELERKVDEAKRLQQRSEIIVQQNPLPILITTKGLKVIVTNKAFLTLSGYSLDKLRTMNLRDFKVLKKTGEGVGGVLDKKIRTFGEVKVEFPNGIKHLQQYAIPILNEKNEISNVFIVYIDVTDLKALVQEVDDSIQQLEVNIRDTSRSTTEIAQAAEKVAIATQKTTNSIRLETDDIQRILKEISELSASIEETAATTQDIMQHANRAAKEGADAAELGRNATEKMQRVEKISQDSVTEITRLNTQMKEISKIVKLIAAISNQTNLLALNASIEAARAGEHGHGFAVVAGEVKALAGQSKTATGNIEELIKTIQKSSEQTAASIQASYHEITGGIERVNKTVEALNRITSEADVVAQGITQITRATEEQAEGTNRVVQGIQRSGEMARENLANIGSMAALAQETSASVQEIASASSEVTSQVGRIKQMMVKFNAE
jgi:methyl-accepting chemotaxis protein